MSVRRRSYKDPETGKVTESWMVDIKFQHPDGRVERVRKISPVNTRRGAEHYEREVRRQLLTGQSIIIREVEPARQVPTFKTFSEEFISNYAMSHNKPSEIHNKKTMLNGHLIPAFGSRRLDTITTRDVEAYVAGKLQSGLKAKTVNNQIAVVSRMFRIAKKWEIVEKIPEVTFLKVQLPEFDFLDFEESDRLIVDADPAWKTMVVVACRTGLRIGELRALRWQDVDLVAGKLTVRQAVWETHIGTPKGGRSREIPLSDDAKTVLFAHRHMRSKLVFCNDDGSMYTKEQMKWPLWRSCKNAGLREVGWHVLRHTFASQLVMMGVPLKVVQELLGHADIQMMMRYAHLSPDVKRDSVKVLDSRGTLGALRGLVPALLPKNPTNTDS